MIDFGSVVRQCLTATVALGLVAGAGQWAAPSVAAETKKAVLILNQPEGDPFGDLVFSGLQRLNKEEGVEAKEIAGVQPAAYEQQVRAMAEQGYSPVLVLWDDLANVVTKLAPSYPNTQFVIVDSYANPGLPNVATLVIDPTGAAYVGGVVAAKLTKTHKIGFVGGADQPVIKKYLCGFETGIHSVDANDQVVADYAGTFIDPARGREMGLSLIGQGADVLIHAANRTGLGMLKAAAEKGKYGIGVDMWQGDVAPGSVKWTALKDAGTATYLAAKAAADGKFKPGIFTWDAAAGATLYDQRDFDALDADTKAAVLKAVGALKDGSAKLAC